MLHAGLAEGADRPADVLIAGFAMGSLSMLPYTLDVPHALNGHVTNDAPPLNGPAADQTICKALLRLAASKSGKATRFIPGTAWRTVAAHTTRESQETP
jgi:hypothetical protein